MNFETFSCVPGNQRVLLIFRACTDLFHVGFRKWYVQGDTLPNIESEK